MGIFLVFFFVDEREVLVVGVFGKGWDGNFFREVCGMFFVICILWS